MARENPGYVEAEGVHDTTEGSAVRAQMIVDAVESADLDVDARMFALEFSALLDGLSIQVALEDPEVDSKVAYDIAMRFAERELNLPADRKRARAR